MVANERPNEGIARRVGELEVVDPSQRISEISGRWVAVVCKKSIMWLHGQTCAESQNATNRKSGARRISDGLLLWPH
jgi:hypothetical protein